MTRLNEEELASLAAQVSCHLAASPYECSSLSLLDGGSVNFVYRGVLVSPLPSGAETVIVKHTSGFLACGRDFKIDVSRCVCLHFYFSSFSFPAGANDTC